MPDLRGIEQKVTELTLLSGEETGTHLQQLEAAAAS